MDARLRGHNEGKVVQKVYPARPQQAKRRNVLKYVEPLSEARTKLVGPSAKLRASFFNIHLDKGNTGVRHRRIKLIRNPAIIA
jgi:hypothetical protein